MLLTSRQKSVYHIMVIGLLAVLVTFQMELTLKLIVLALEIVLVRAADATCRDLGGGDH